MSAPSGSCFGSAVQWPGIGADPQHGRAIERRHAVFHADPLRLLVSDGVAVVDLITMFEHVTGKGGNALKHRRAGQAGYFELDLATNEPGKPKGERAGLKRNEATSIHSAYG